MNRLCRQFLTSLAIFVLATLLAQGATFNAVTQFSSTTNVAGNTWSYWGATNTDVTNFFTNVSLLPVFFADCGSGTTCWDATGTEDNLILRNITGSDVLGFPNSNARNNQLTYYTRSGIVDVRFLAPTTSTYSLTGFFEGSSPAPEVTREVITVNHNVAGALLNLTGAVPLGTVHPFSFGALSLNSGDIVDFLVEGVNTTGDRNSLSTGFTAIISNEGTTVPEPASIWLAFTAGVFLVLWKWRRSAAGHRA